MVYLVVLVLLAYLICRYDILDGNINRVFWERCIVFMFIVIAGFRYRIGGDTINYLEIFYHETPYLWEISFDDLFNSTFEPLGLLLFSVVFSVGGKFFVIQLIQAIFVNILLFRFFKKHTQYVFSCFFLYFIWMYIYYDFEELRAGISVVLCLLGNDYLLEKKWLKGYLLYLIAVFFHYSSILLLLTPLFLLLRFNIVGVFLIIMSIPVSSLLLKLFGDYLLLLNLDSQISMKASGYINSDEHTQAVGIWSYLVDVSFPVFYVMISYWYLCVKNHNEKLHKLQPFVILAILFLCMSVNLDIVRRYMHFYAPYLIVFYAVMFVELIKNDAKVTKSLALLRSIAFFFPLFYYFSATYREVPQRMLDKSCRNYQKYYPYSSVLEKSLSDKREKLFRNLYNIDAKHTDIRVNEY